MSEPGGEGRFRGGWILAAAVLGSGMVFVDGTVVNVALPVMQRALRADAADMQWVVEAYALFLAALLLVGGSLGDRWGRRRVFAWGTGIFALASAACGMAPGTGWLIAARAAQGVGGALLVPGSLAILQSSFPADQRARAIGTWSGLTSVAAGIGPVVGGFLVERLSWRWAFFINVPLAAVVLAVLALHVPETRDPSPGRPDLWGAMLGTLALGGLAFGLTEGPRRGMGDALVIAALAGGVLALAAFVAVEARTREPMVPLGLFRSPVFAGANLLTLLLYGALSGALYFLPFDLVQVQGYGPTAAGASLLPFTVLMLLLSPRSGAWATRHGARRPLLVGPAVAALGLALLGLGGRGGGYWASVFPGIFVLGLGMAIAVAPLTATVMAAVEERHAGLASGVNNAVSRTAALLAIAAMGSLAAGTFGGALDRRTERLSLPPAARESLLRQRDRLAAAEVPAGLPAPQARAVRAALDDSFGDAFRRVLFLCAGLALTASAGALLIPDPRAGVGTGDRAAP
ncbi:MAG: transporter [Gemmatimonadetes bacterium]|nr:transporter [Gemmatimonadota bacterium]